MRKLLCFSAFGVVLLSSAYCQASEVKVQVFRGADMIQAVTLPEGKVKAAAKNFDFDTAANTWSLAGGCAITIVQDEKHSIRFEGEAAKIQAAAEDIEWQIAANDPIDIRNVPAYDLLGALKKIPKESSVRLMWYYTMGGYLQGNTALYDRSNNTIKEYSRVSDNSTETGGIYSYVFTNVTDDVIEKAAKSVGSAGPFSFSLLEDFGATRKERR